MTKFSAKKCLLLCLIVSLVLIVAGAFVFGFAGMNLDSTMKDYTSVEVTDNGYMANDANYRTALEDFCLEEIEKEYAVEKVLYSGFQLDTHLEFILSDIASDAELAALADKLEEALAGEAFGEGLTLGTAGDVSVGWHVAVYAPHYEYVWRTAIGFAAVLVLLFAYVAIRFKVGMGVTALVAALHDTLLTFALLCLVRIPMGASFICILAFAMLLSVFFSLKLFGKMRKDFRMEERKELASEESVLLSASEGRKGIFFTAIALAAVSVVLAVVGLIAGFDLFAFMAGALVAVIVCTYSALLLSPSLYALIKKKSDEDRAKKAKYNYASEKANKKNAKEEGTRAEEPAGNA